MPVVRTDLSSWLFSVLGIRLDLYRIINNEVHELVKALKTISDRSTATRVVEIP